MSEELPPGTVPMDVDQDPPPPPPFPDADGSRCDFCQKRMIPYLMSVADHVAWERSLKCAECYKRSIFKEQHAEFEALVDARIASLTREILPAVTPEVVQRIFPAIESTVNIKMGGMRIRIWRKQDKLSNGYDDVDLVRAIASEILKRRDVGGDELVRFVADLPGVAAVEFQDAPKYIEQAEVTHGFVVYAEWP